MLEFRLFTKQIGSRNPNTIEPQFGGVGGPAAQAGTTNSA